MATSTDRREPSGELKAAGESEHPSRRGWQTATVVLAVAVVGLGAVVVADLVADDDDSVPAGMTQLLDDFEVAYETEDEGLFRSIVTDDYFFTEDFYRLGGSTPAFSAAGPVDAVAGFTGPPSNVERSGEPVVVGDGPWIVAVTESWMPDRFNRADGMAIYVIVEDRGAMRIAKYYFAGTLVDVQAELNDG